MKSRRLNSAHIIGSGPNGLAAAIVLARAGVETTVFEAQSTIGGGCRSFPLTLPGFTHDLCSAVHPMAVSSPIFQTFPLAEHGLQWIQPPLPLAHPLDDGSAVVLDRSLDRTCEALGPDGDAWRKALEKLVSSWDLLAPEILGPPLHLPSHPLLLMQFGMLAGWPATVAARVRFRTRSARALFAGIAAHSVLRLEQPLSGAFGWALAIAGHSKGWPIVRGGSQQLANALASYLRSLGGRIITGANIRSLREVDDADIVMCDVAPRQLLALAGDQLPKGYARKLKMFVHGPGVFKLDWALSEPIPWKALECSQAGTIHLGGTLDQIGDSERAAWDGKEHPRPYVLLAQPSLFDPTRAPEGQHTAWAYCHVPNGSTVDMTDRIEAQVERFAPGFRSRILARSAMNTVDVQSHNENLQGGDISGGATLLSQFVTRPTSMVYRTPLRRVYLCSSSTPPGGGVHGMCGYHAALCALADYNSLSSVIG